MAASFFFYDLETTGVKCHECRVMQFAGQRTDLDLNPVGEPVNVLIKLTPDFLPDPEAILLTGITPQQTIADGLTEYEFLQFFETEVATPDTIFVGYNTVRFDDECMRCLRFRNFHDPYDWQWKQGRSRWDLLDLVRMTRALRPDGIEWPFTDDGKPTNRLELITKLNGLDHDQAHDALSDVLASIAVAKLIRDKQPKLFDWLLQLRSKQAAQKFLEQNETFVYSSGKYDNDCQKTAVVERLALGDGQRGALVYDLRHDPREFAELSVDELIERWQYSKDPEAPKRLPVKTLKYNRCPAICPTGLIADEAVQQRLGITLESVNQNRAYLKALPQLREKILEARIKMDAQRRQKSEDEECDLPEVESLIYDGFLDEHDGRLLQQVRQAEPLALGDYAEQFHDKRMREIVPRYKARNFPGLLTDDENQAWEAYRKQKLFEGGTNSQLALYFKKLGECAKDPKYTDKQFLLEELQLYGQSLMPAEFD